MICLSVFTDHCGVDWVYFPATGSCYFYSTDTVVSVVDDLLQVCEEKNSVPVKFDTIEEKDEVKKYNLE